MGVMGLHRAGRRPATLAALLSALTLVALTAARPGTPGQARPIVDAIASLPAPAQAAISRILGRDQRAYRAHTTSGELSIRNDAQQLRARFSRSGVQVNSGSTRLGISLRRLGYGTRLAPVSPATPRGRANRIVYERGPLTEWYLNGPVGLEQGFTLRRAPERGGGPLTLELSLSGAKPRLESRTGLSFQGSSLRYQGLFAVDASGKRLPAWLELRRRKVRVLVDDADARYPVTIDPFLQQAKLIAADAADDQLGFSVAVSGDTVVVGAPFAAVGGNTGAGAAYVFVKPGGGWASGTQTAKLTASDGEVDGNFGHSVAISGDVAVVGAPNATVSGHAARGAAYVFAKPGGGWASSTQTAKLTASDGAVGHQLGYSVGIDADTIVVGAALAAPASRGAAYLFVKPGGGWVTGTQTAKLTASDGAANDRLGSSVGVSVDTVVAGAPNDDSARGAAYVFVRPVTGWANSTQTAKLTASDRATFDNLGVSVGISGDTVVAGASGDDTGRGSAYVFVRPISGWTTAAQTAKLTASDGAVGDQLGISAAVSGDTIVSGANGVGGQGAGYVFVRPGGGWVNAVQTAKLTASDGVADEFGTSVAISSGTVVAGAPAASVGGNGGQGAAYMFVKPGAAWTSGTQTAKLVSGGGAGDSLGLSIAISGDTVVAGAPQADVAGMGDQGAVYVFVKPLSGWVGSIQSAKLIAADGAAADELGQSVAVSGDTVVAGAPGADGGDPDQGGVYVFVKPGSVWMSGTETAKLTAGDGAVGDQLGVSVAVSTDTVAAGAPGADVGDNDDGAAYVFVKPGGGWVSGMQTAKLISSDGAGFDQLGFSVAISGDTVAAGAPFADVGAGDDGAVYVFVKPGGSWASATETGKLTAAGSTASANLGHSVAASADTVAAGAPGADSRGAAYVYVKPGGGWGDGVQTAKLTASDGTTLDQLGYSIALDGSTLVAGAPNDTVGANAFRGSAYAFLRPGVGWTTTTQTEKLTAADGAPGDQLGYSVAASGGTVVAGAPFVNVVGSSDEGAAYVFVSSPPTAVRLHSFAARRAGAGVVVRWRTVNELRTIGFSVFREQGGARVRLTRTLLPARGGQAGRSYAYLDRRAPRAGVFRYWIQAAESNGGRTWHGPVALG